MHISYTFLKKKEKEKKFILIREINLGQKFIDNQAPPFFYG